MDLTFKVSMQFCSLQHLTLLPSSVTSTTCIVFGLGQPLYSFWSYFSTSPVAYWSPATWGVHLSMSYLLTFLYCSWGSQGKNTEVFCHSLLQWITFCQYSSAWRLHGMAHSFTELDKAVIHVIFFFFWLVFYDCDTPCPRAKEKPQQDGRRGEIAFRLKPHTHQRRLEGSNKTQPLDVH